MTLRATGSVVVFDGFLALYQEDRDDPAEDEEGRHAPAELTEGEAVTRESVTPEQHFTQPPPRYSEASLVKRLEELGIGRPSTYASILQVLQDRNYVRLEKRRFIPEDRGRLVTAFLTSFFERYVDYDFTALLEEQLDDISGGRIDWKKVLRDFWRDFSDRSPAPRISRITQVIDTLDDELGPHFFPANANGARSRASARAARPAGSASSSASSAPSSAARTIRTAATRAASASTTATASMRARSCSAAIPRPACR